MSDFVGQIILVAFNYAPQGYALCQGQLLPIAQYDTLFTLIGTTYGGDGQNNFALPDLRGRIPISMGQAPGQQDYPIGELAGNETITLTVPQLAPHAHAIDASAFTATAQCKNGAGNQQTPVGNVHAVEAAGVTMPYSSAAPNAAMNAAPVAVSGPITLSGTGGNSPHDNMQPFLTLNFCICLFGPFPSQL